MSLRKFLLNTDKPLTTTRKLYNVIDYTLWALGLTWIYVLSTRVYFVAPLHEVMLALAFAIPLGALVVAMLHWHKELEERGE